MCGFAGIVAWDDRYRVDRAMLERMSARIAHRGPDGEGLWVNHEGEVNADRPQVGLVHRRLAIIDLDERANQPFTDGRGRWLVFNGEIYNYRELRKELESLLPDYSWRTQSDTEVLLASYAAWGEKCLDHLNGMFAFAVWDENQKELFLARDRMGQKPLYVYSDGSPAAGFGPNNVPRVIAFASELGALVALDSIPRRVDHRDIHEYLAWGYVPSGGTVYSDCWTVRPAEWWRIGGQGPCRRTYFEPNSTDTPALSDGEAVERTRTCVSTAVTRQLIADVPLGCFLSGGVDSSIIAACMKRAVGSGQAVHTFSIRFDDPRYNESEYAAAVADHLGTSHHEFPIEYDAAEDLPKLAAAFGEPFGDSSALPTHYLCQATRKHVKVALSGDGGDELFGGYDRYRALQFGRALGWVPQPLRWAAHLAVRSVPGAHPKSSIARLKRFTATWSLHARHRYESYLRLFTDAQLAAIDPENHDWKLGIFGGTVWDRGVHDPVRAAIASDRVTYLPYDLLTKVDRCSMLHALEVRSPFMDHELVRFASTLTTAQLLKGGPKRMLREAFAADLPAWVFKRKKMGFAVPIGEWFRGPLRSMLRDHLFAANSFAAAHFNRPVIERLVEEHESQRVDHSQRLYALLMLELWWKMQSH